MRDAEASGPATGPQEDACVEMTYAQALNRALSEEMERDERVVVLGEDIATHGGVFSVTRGLAERFSSRRVCDTPISEQAIIGAALGAALTGMRPVAELQYLDFATVAMDQIVQQVAKIRYMTAGQVSVPLVIRAQGGGGKGNAAQHSQSLEAWFVHVPGLYVVQPSTPADARGLLITAIRQNNPVMFLEHKLLYSTRGPVPVTPLAIPLGVADVKRSGRDVTVVATSRMVLMSLTAAEALAREGIEVEVIDPRSLVPLDIDTIVASVKRTAHALVVHEAVRRGGIGAEIAAQIMEQAFDYLDMPVARVGAAPCPIPYARDLEDAVLPKVGDIVSAVRALVR